MKKMKRKITAGAGVALAAVAAVTLAGCGNSKPDVVPDESKRSAVHTENQLFVNDYTMDVTLLTDNNSVEIVSKADIENNTEQTLDEIVFLNPSSKVYEKDGNQEKSWEIRNVYLGDDESAKLDFTQDAADTEIIRVSLGDNTLAPKEKISITIDVREDIPFGDSRFGYFNLGKYSEFVLTSCFPQMAEYRNNAWVINKTEWTDKNIKEDTYSQFSDYHVKVHAPEGYTAAASGTEIIDDDGVINIESVDTRDFAMVLSDGFRSIYYANDETTVNYFFMEDAKSYKTTKEVIELGVPVTIDWMQEKIVKYPWSQYDIVPLYDDSACNAYTGLMTFGGKDIYDGLDGGEIDDYRIKMVLEFKEGTLDQWFSEMIVTNRATDGWLSRGLLTWFNDYISVSATNDAPGRRIKDIISEAREQHPDEMNMKLNDTIADAEARYIVDSYRGAEFLETVYSEIGDEEFILAINEFMNEYYLKDATTEDFLNMLMKHDNGKVQAIIDEYFNQ